MLTSPLLVVTPHLKTFFRAFFFKMISEQMVPILTPVKSWYEEWLSEGTEDFDFEFHFTDEDEGAWEFIDVVEDAESIAYDGLLGLFTSMENQIND